MGSPLFLGAEHCDYQLTGAWNYEDEVMAYTNHSRDAIGSVADEPGAQAYTDLPSAVTDACIMAHWKEVTWTRALDEVPFLAFTSSGQREVGIKVDSATSKLLLVSWNGATYDTIDTYSSVLSPSVPIRFDFAVNDYGTANCRLRVWARYIMRGSPYSYYDIPFPVFDKTGDYGDSADLDGIVLTSIWPSEGGYAINLDEVVVHEDLTLRMRLVTLTPNGAATTADWSGAYTDIDEVAANDSDAIESATNGAIFRCELSDLPTATETVLAVQAVDRAAYGLTGPQKQQLGFCIDSTDYFSGDISLDAAYAGYKGDLLVTNPDTAAAWSRAEVNALQLAIKAVT
jgi:hypothetical protein